MTSAIESKPLSLFAEPDDRVKQHKNDAGNLTSVCANCHQNITGRKVSDEAGDYLWKHNQTQFMGCYPFGYRPAAVSGRLGENREV